MMRGQTSIMGSSPFTPNESSMKLTDLCRMCASPCSTPVLIFGTEGVENELATKFNSYLPVKVSSSDSLPLQLCYECTNLLIQWDASVLVAIAADKKLRALQWREQQSRLQLPNNEIPEKNLPSPEQPKKRKLSSNTGESLCCSVCNRSGMEFRELVDHLKTHEMPAEQTRPRSSSISFDLTQEEENSESDHLVDEELLRPVVCLETLDNSKIELSPKSRTSVSKPVVSKPLKNVKNNTDTNKRLHVSKLKSFFKLGASVNAPSVERGSGDPVVTSSTSTLLKPAENVDVEDLLKKVSAESGAKSASNKPSKGKGGHKNESPAENQGQNSTFKPKVRIISAESINQTLEERAKANQNARHLESRGPNAGSGPASGAVPTAASSVLKPGASQMKRIIISGEIVKNLKGTTGPGTKFLKLADGRIVRLVEGSSKVPSKNAAVVHQPVPTTVLNKMTAQSADKHPLKEGASSPDSEVQLGNQSLDNSEMVLPSAPLKQSVKIGNSRIITFNLQPGPKHSANRYTCVFCGRRNLSQDCLQEHAQEHTPKTDVSPLKTGS